MPLQTELISSGRIRRRVRRSRRGGRNYVTPLHGDTLSEIAARYGVTANALKRRNAIRGDKIRVGQTPFIPGDPDYD